MADTGQKPGPIQFVLRLYPGQDDALICWLAELEARGYGAKTRAVKKVLLQGITDGEPLRARHPGPGLECPAESPGPTTGHQDVPTASLTEIRQVVEAAITSALGRFDQVAGAPAPRTAEAGDEVEDLLDTLGQALVLGEE